MSFDWIAFMEKDRRRALTSQDVLAAYAAVSAADARSMEAKSLEKDAAPAAARHGAIEAPLFAWSAGIERSLPVGDR